MLTKKNFPLCERRFGALDYLISVSLFALLFVCIFFLCVIVLGFVFFKLPQPLKMTEYATLGALYISAFVSSFIISKKNGQKYFLCAFFNSVFLASLLFLLSLFGNNGIFDTYFLLRLVSVPICFLGAFLGIKRDKIKKHRHRR